jgi:CRISPR-associated protein Csm2
MPQPTTQPSGGRRDHPAPSAPRPALDVTRIRFTQPLDPELFNSIAEEAAKAVGANGRSNKPSQLRRFYDELILWESKVARQPDKFNEYLPFIRMINAKVAYARGRNQLVDDQFVTLMHHALRQITDAQSVTTCKLFWEAFMGFYKKVRPSD